MPNQCEYCLIKFTRKSSLTRHYDRCRAKSQKDLTEKICNEILNKNLSVNNHTEQYNEKYIENIILKHKLELQQKDLEMKDFKIGLLEKQIEKTESTDIFHQKVIETSAKNVGDLIKTNMKALTFLNTYHTGAKQLQNFEVEYPDPYAVYAQDGIKYDGEGYDINGEYYEKDEYIVEKTLLLQKTGDTVKFYANLMEKIYKNIEYPHLQSYWASDAERNNFIVFQQATDEISRWFTDKDGLIITSKVITPLLNFTVDVLRKRLTELDLEQKRENDRKNKNFNKIMSIVRKKELLAE